MSKFATPPRHERWRQLMGEEKQMSKPTPGPWKVPRHAWFQVVPEEALPGDYVLAQCYESRQRSVEEAKANAHLIAAAPELYEAARAVYFQTYGHGPEQKGRAMEELGEAIAKAEGREHGS